MSSNVGTCFNQCLSIKCVWTNGSGNNFGDDGARQMEPCLRLFTSLTKLDLSQNRITNHGVGYLTVLRYLTLLVGINLSGNRIKNQGDYHHWVSFKRLPKLVSLDLSGNKIGNDGAKYLVMSFYVSFCVGDLPYLSRLDLRGNALDEEGKTWLKNFWDRQSLDANDVLLL